MWWEFFFLWLEAIGLMGVWFVERIITSGFSKNTMSQYNNCLQQSARSQFFDESRTQHDLAVMMGKCQTAREYVNMGRVDGASGSSRRIHALLPDVYPKYCNIHIQNEFRRGLGLDCTADSSSNNLHLLLKVGGILLLSLSFAFLLVKMPKTFKNAAQKKTFSAPELLVEGYEEEDEKQEATELEQAIQKYEALEMAAKQKGMEVKPVDIPDPLCCMFSYVKCTRPVRFSGLNENAHFDLAEIQKYYKGQSALNIRHVIKTPFGQPIFTDKGMRRLKRAWDIEAATLKIYKAVITELENNIAAQQDNKESFSSPNNSVSYTGTNTGTATRYNGPRG